MARTKAALFRFTLRSFDEVADMSPREWKEECRLCGADMKPHRDEEREHPHAQENT